MKRDNVPCYNAQRADSTRPAEFRGSLITPTERAENFIEVGGGMVRCRYCAQPKSGPMFGVTRGLKLHLRGKQHLASVAAAKAAQAALAASSAKAVRP